MYLYAAMVFWAPLEHHLYYEAAAITDARYRQIAADVAGQVQDPEERPLFDGPNGRAQTATYVMSIFSLESGEFRADVQFCTKSGDGGHSWGLGQSQAGKDAVCLGVRAAVHEALIQIRESRAACADLIPEHRLALYASGSCSRGHRESANRVNRAMKYWASHPYVTAAVPSPAALAEVDRADQ
jgi:hypothetical protein